MEVGAVKQAFNNEVISLKKKLNQAKIQIIHKLTRKAKQLTETKAPEPLKEKLKRKAESAVKEVLIMKKINAKDLAKFMVTHKGELNICLNKPLVDQDKACARLLLHKALQDKYKFIRGRFSNVPIQDLFMSRIERRKMKKEAKEKQKNKKKGKDKKVVNSEGDWSVEDVEMGKVGEVEGDDNAILGDEGNDIMSSDENAVNEASGDDNEISGDEGNDIMSSDENVDSEASADENDESEADNPKDKEIQNDSESDIENSDNEVKQKNSKIVKSTPKVITTVIDIKSNAVKNDVAYLKKLPKEIVKKNPVKKQKELNKTKNFNEKILQKKLKKDSETPAVENKIVDPFFVTATGGNYMSVVEPRAPDEIKEEHRQGNRKLRRAVMFGYVPKSKLRQNNNYYNEDNRQNGYDRGNSFKGKFNDRPQFNDRKTFNDRNNFNDRKTFNNDKSGFNNRNDRNNDEKPEKLHPSWEAKKKKSGILPFEGKKIVFDES